MRRPPGTLTDRQKAVARLVGIGLTNREIGEQLVISVRTVDQHVHDVMVSLGLTRRAEIVRLAATAATFGVAIGTLFEGAAL